MNPYKTISIAKDFSKFPSGRKPQDGPYCAEKFREELLIPAMHKYKKVYVELDGTLGYASSFLEEVFGKLDSVFSFIYNENGNIGNMFYFKYNEYDVKDERQLIIISREDSSLIKEIWSYINANPST